MGASPASAVLTAGGGLLVTGVSVGFVIGGAGSGGVGVAGMVVIAGAVSAGSVSGVLFVAGSFMRNLPLVLGLLLLSVSSVVVELPVATG